ncbi:MAG: 4-oxalocrotonate tautomerase [Gemmatimonadaceae bacterium]|nr:4-oxalocrotonate tautomerase [Gemmatimonadaceae bacterium]NUQ93204.1 4-oxalocrotonate tautomerase [Gemmatimonadaceae bacterium]NUR18972.1 4-oxalocrotonate tautomerase [Gemmatimonadaceae bacterium]NUS96214.1 4-oxalocrotonate tautomerase [Gemmatimonadaceae bacterium]
MPHVIVKMIAGRTEELNQRLADRITEDLVGILRIDEKSISVAIEDIAPDDWTEQVYNPDINLWSPFAPPDPPTRRPSADWAR